MSISESALSSMVQFRKSKHVQQAFSIIARLSNYCAPPPQAICVHRQMRGGSRACLVKASDGNYYVVKFKQNPQGARTLVNDFLGAGIFLALGISTAPAMLISLTREFLSEERHKLLTGGSAPLNVEPGLHFASLYPGDPSRTVVHDLVPSAVARALANKEDFVRSLVVDKWLANCDYRQAIYWRHTNGWLCQMVDFGHVFGGPSWEFHDAAEFGLALDRSVYCVPSPFRCLETCLERVECFSEETLIQIASAIPDDWLEGENGRFGHLLEKLLDRRKRVRSLLVRILESDAEPFRSWRRWAQREYAHFGRCRRS